ncbi:MAG: choice-of-anchor L domain-containing protein [Saprospiraceae bacterium]|nr:choice-of-anchor L domain-containing protein [Saprospiraceae bacterium]
MKHSLILLLSFCFISQLAAQERKSDLQAPMDLKGRGVNDLIIDTNYTVEELIMDFFANTCVTPFNITLNGNKDGMAFFQGANTDLDMPAGIVIASGNVSNIHGPNNMGNAGNGFELPGDADLDELSQEFTLDAILIEFDFISNEPELFFKYVFGSEEYPEFVCASFNDVFGFFISGPGINGPFTGNAINIATLPNSTLPVGINTINQGINFPKCDFGFSQFYIDNLGGLDLQYDGFTTPLEADFIVIPGETYHAKIAVSDAGDSHFDSGVFISVASLCGDSLFTPIASLAASHPQKNQATFEGRVKYAYNDWTLDFGDGQQSVMDGPVTHTYANPGIYTATISGTNYCCTGSTTHTVYIQQPPFIEKANIFAPSCFDSSDGVIELNVESSIGNLTYSWSDGGQGPHRTSLPAGLYTVTITDADGNSTVSSAFDLQVDPLVAEVKLPVVKSKKVDLLLAGGHAPYSILWEDGRTEAIRYDLIPGKTYIVQVVDARGCSKLLTFDYGKNNSVHHSDIFISPNPANASLRVAIGSNEGKSGRIQIFDLLGHQMYDQEVSGAGAWDLPVHFWPNGIYMLHYQYDGGVESRLIFIKH